MMRVVLLNTFEDQGGAARAAVRLFEGLRRLPADADLEARMLVRETGAGRPGVARIPGPPASWTSRLDQRALKAAHPERERVPFSVNRVLGLAIPALRAQRPDVAHLHWLHCGLVRIEALARLSLPVVWTLHDMWAFTGVCHYAGGCEGYLRGCGACPRLRSEDARDVSARTFARKAATWPRLNLTLVCPSRWLAAQARRSPLLGARRTEVIPNGLDTDVFRPLSDAQRAEARQRLGLPPLPSAPGGRPVVLFGADYALADPRKGGGELLAALRRTGLDADAAVFGHDGPLPDAGGMNIHGLGYFRSDAALAEVYAACDLYVLPTLEDNLPNTVLEALACGAPVLGSDAGGLPEMVEDGENGLLLRGFAKGGTGLRAEALARGLREALDLLADPARAAAMRTRAREKALREYALDVAAGRYAELYRTLR